MPNMQTSLVFAEWVAKNGKALIDHYYGENFDLETGQYHESEIPIIPIETLVPREEHELVYWINNSLMFIKTLARLFHHRLAEDLIDIQLPLGDYDSGYDTDLSEFNDEI